RDADRTGQRSDCSEEGQVAYLHADSYCEPAVTGIELPRGLLAKMLAAVCYVGSKNRSRSSSRRERRTCASVGPGYRRPGLRSDPWPLRALVLMRVLPN